MSAKSRFLDTNILLYLVTDDPRKKISGQLIQGRGNSISMQVLNEFVSVARRKYNLDWAEVKTGLKLFERRCQILDMTFNMHSRAVDIAERHRLHIYDANIIAAAEASGASVLYSEDLQAGRQFGETEIVNPYM